MPWRRIFVLFVATVFFTSNLVWAAPPSAWAALTKPALRICAGTPDQEPASSEGARDIFEVQVGTFISLAHSNITEGSSWNVTFDAGDGRAFTFPCEDTFDGFLRIIVPFFPDHDCIDDQDTLITVTIEGLPGAPVMLAETPPDFGGEYYGQGLAMMLERSIEAYQELIPVLRQRAARGYVPADLYAAADSLDQYVAELQAKVTQIKTYNILTVTEVDGDSYSLSFFGLSHVDNMLATSMLGLSDELQVRDTYLRTGSWPMRTMAERKIIDQDQLRDGLGYIYKMLDILQGPHARMLLSFVGIIAIVGAAFLGGAGAAFVSGSIGIVLVYISGGFETVSSFLQNATKKDGHLDVALTMLKNALKAISNMLGAQDFALRWLFSAYNAMSTVYDGVMAYFEATGGGGGGGDDGGDDSGGGDDDGGGDSCYDVAEGDHLPLNGSVSGTTDGTSYRNPNKYKMIVRDDGWLKITIVSPSRTCGSYGFYQPETGCEAIIAGGLDTATNSSAIWEVDAGTKFVRIWTVNAACPYQVFVNYYSTEP